MTRAAALALTLALTLAPAALAQKEPPMKAEAKEHFDRAIAHYAAQAWEPAIQELSAAYFIDPRREILFAWAQAERLSGDCGSAIPLYRKYLESSPPAKTADVARQHLAACEAQAPPPAPDPTERPPEKPAEPQAPPEKPAAPPPVEPAPAPAEPLGKPWYEDPLGDALVGAGVVGLGVGITFLVLSNASKSDAQDATCYCDFEDAASQGKTRRTISLVALGAGSALIAGGILRFILREDHVEAPAVSLQTGETRGVVLGWSF